MADLAFNTPSGQNIDREKLVAYLNTGTSSASLRGLPWELTLMIPVWDMTGRRTPRKTFEELQEIL